VKTPGDATLATLFSVIILTALNSQSLGTNNGPQDISNFSFLIAAF